MASPSLPCSNMPTNRRKFKALGAMTAACGWSHGAAVSEDGEVFTWVREPTPAGALVLPEVHLGVLRADVHSCRARGGRA